MKLEAVLLSHLKEKTFAKNYQGNIHTLNDVLEEKCGQYNKLSRDLLGGQRTHRNEKVRHTLLVLNPGSTVLLTAAGNVSPGAVGDHAAEEDGVEPGEGALEASDEAPADGEVGVAAIMDLAGEAVPAVDQDAVADVGLDDLGVVDCLPGQLGEGLALDHLAALHGAEAVLLAVAAVPDPVDKQVAGVERNKRIAVPAVLLGRVVGEVDGAVAVRQGDTSKVPEDEHEAPLLVVHVPGGHNELLTFGAGVGVEEVSHNQETDLARDVAITLPLAGRGTAR